MSGKITENKAFSKDGGGMTFPIGWMNCALTSVIIATRAFQPNAAKMSEWSVLSWILMFTPILYPIYIFIAAKLLYVVLLVLNKPIIWCTDAACRTWNRIFKHKQGI